MDDGVPVMANDPARMERIAEVVYAALQSADLTGYRDLLDPDVTWGAPDDMNSGCRNRDEVLAWYRRGWVEGVRADVLETEVCNDKILVGMDILDGRPTTGPEDGTHRWQVLTVRNGLVVDIRGFEDRDAAVARLG